MGNSSYPQFSDPYTARLVKLRNILLLAPNAGAIRPRIETDNARRGAGDPARARPTFEEMMAIVNRPRRRRRE